MSSEIFNEVDETLKVEDKTEEPKSKNLELKVKKSMKKLK
jgi:hypothetical protein